MLDKVQNLRVSSAPMAAVQTDLAHLVEATIARWREVAAALSPVIGSRGVATMFKRSLHLSRVEYPWLSSALRDGAEADYLSALRGVLLQQTPANAVAGDGALLHTFFKLLGTLIGPALAKRLIGFTHQATPSGHAAEDTAP